MSISRPGTLLVVDDTVPNRFVVRRILESGGYEVAEAGSGAELAAEMAKRVPELVVLDVRLPDSNGFELTRGLKGDPSTHQIPILLLSASFTTDDAKAAGLDAGADGYLTHPVEPPVLLATVRSLIRARLTERRMTALYQIGAALGATLSTEQILEVVGTEVLRAIEADAASLAIVQSGAIAVMPGRGHSDEVRQFWQGRSIALNPTSEARASTPVEEAIRSREPVILGPYEAWRERFPDVPADVAATEFASRAIVPCVLDDRVLGTVGVSFRTPRVFTNDDIRFVLAVGQQCAQALERARLYQAAQRAQQAAETANRAKVDFLATMSHELRTPLNAIAGYAELIALGVRGPLTSEQSHDIDRILRSQKHLLGLINEVLNYARLETGRLEYDLADVAVGALLESLDAFISPQVSAKGIVYECRATSPGIRIRADAEKVQQILLNLLSNSIKFTAPGGRISVTAEQDAGEVAIRVVDTGRGIPTEKLESIFEPFVQVDRRLTSDQQGTGLGLSISRELARGMGGELTVESLHGEGSTFTLRLAAAAPSRAAAAAQPGYSPSAHPDGL
jgi:signal transduction histidine kinase